MDIGTVDRSWRQWEWLIRCQHKISRWLITILDISFLSVRQRSDCIIIDPNVAARWQPLAHWRLLACADDATPMLCTYGFRYNWFPRRTVANAEILSFLLDKGVSIFNFLFFLMALVRRAHLHKHIRYGSCGLWVLQWPVERCACLWISVATMHLQLFGE